MCIDLYVPGTVIDIPFLSEQVWIDRDKNDPSKISVIEVYDVLVQNPLSNPEISEINALFANDCTELNNATRTLSIKPCVVTPGTYKRFNEDGRDYEWLFDKPVWRDETQTSIVRGYTSLSDDPREKTFKTMPGKVLVLTVDFPKNMTAELQRLFADPPILKTLACLNLDKPLKAGEAGWFRLIVKPIRIDQSTPRKRTMGDSLPIHFSHRLSVTSPILVRDRVCATIELAESNKIGAVKDIPKYQQLRGIVLEDGIYSEGTSIRIDDHRIAIIGCGNVDIVDASSNEAALFYGIIPSLDPSIQTALWWSSGSERNLDTDLVYNLERVVNMLIHSGPSIDKKEITRDLAPSGKHEAFSTLLDQMVKAELLQQIGQNLCLGKDIYIDRENNIDRVVFEPRLVNLRKVYGHASVQDELLASNFVDLHPFNINYCATWYSMIS